MLQEVNTCWLAVCELRFLYAVYRGVGFAVLSALGRIGLHEPDLHKTAGGENGQETENAIQDAGKTMLASLQFAESQSRKVCQGRW